MQLPDRWWQPRAGQRHRNATRRTRTSKAIDAITCKSTALPQVAQLPDRAAPAATFIPRPDGLIRCRILCENGKIRVAVDIPLAHPNQPIGWRLGEQGSMRWPTETLGAGSGLPTAACQRQSGDFSAVVSEFAWSPPTHHHKSPADAASGNTPETTRRPHGEQQRSVRAASRNRRISPGKRKSCAYDSQPPRSAPRSWHFCC
jgi:hypothetical protein